MALLPAVAHGTCPCGGRYEGRQVEVRMSVNGQTIRLGDVPQGACPHCNSRVYKAETIARIESIMRGSPLDPFVPGPPDDAR